MAAVSATYKAMFDNQCSLELQQMGSQIREAVTVENNVHAKTFQWTILDKAATHKNRGRGDLGATHLVDDNWSVATATLAEYESFEEMKKSELVRNPAENAVPRLIKSIKMALGRSIDTEIMTALNTGAGVDTTNFPAAGVNVTKANLIKLRQIAGENNFNHGSEWTALVTPKTFSDVISLQEVSSTDYNVKNLYMKRREANFAGIRFLEVNEMQNAPGTTANKQRCFLFEKDCVGLAVGIDIEAAMRFSPSRNSYIFAGVLLAGSAVIQQEGTLSLHFN